MYGTHPENFRKDDRKYRDAAVTVCGCIRNRQVETQRFKAFNDAIRTLSYCSFLPELTATRGYVKENSDMLCLFIAWFCSTNNLVYNNKNTSVEEMKQIRALQIGKVLWDNFLYAKDATPEMNPDKSAASASAASAPASATASSPAPSAAQPNSTASTLVQAAASTASTTSASTAAPSTSSTPAAAGSAGQTVAATPKTGGAAGHTLYRRNAGGILTQGKVTGISNDGYVYWVGGEFDKPGKTQPKIHVKPQSASAPLKVNYGSGQGYNDCILYFTSEAAVKAFLPALEAHKPANVKSLKVKKIEEDKNGYVEVDTEFGHAYIKASKLHEDIEEDLEQTDKPEQNISNKEVAEAYLDGFFKD